MRLQLIIIYWAFAVMVQSEDHLINYKGLKKQLSKVNIQFSMRNPSLYSLIAMRMTSRYQRDIWTAVSNRLNYTLLPNFNAYLDNFIFFFKLKQ